MIEDASGQLQQGLHFGTRKGNLLVSREEIVHKAAERSNQSGVATKVKFVD